MKTVTVYHNTGQAEVFEKMQEIRRRRGYPKDWSVWEILVDMDRKLSDAEAKTAEKGR